MWICASLSLASAVVAGLMVRKDRGLSGLTESANNKTESPLNMNMLFNTRLFSSLSRFLFCVSLLAPSMAQVVPAMPKIEGENLIGQKVLFPDAATGKVAVLIFGFTKASKVPTSAWGDKLNADFGTRPDFTLYQLPVLEDVPRLLRGMVISGIKKGVPENKREHFVPILQGEAELKKFVNYHEPDDAYLVVLGRKGETLAQTHGTPDDANYARLRARLDSALNSK